LTFQIFARPLVAFPFVVQGSALRKRRPAAVSFTPIAITPGGLP
jgi:hypothetical protein